MTNDSFFPQTWAISVPNRNSDVKSISWPTGPPRVRSQNKGYWQYLSKIKGKLFGIFTKFWSNLWVYGIKIIFIQLLCFKTVLGEVLITPRSQAIWIAGIILSLNSGILPISLILTSHSWWPCWPWYWLNIRVSVRYRNRPCLGRKWVIGHQILCNIRSYKSLLDNFGKNKTPCKSR